MAVPFERGKTGYIDVSRASIQKLSDADFPFFMGWQKIGDGNTPFDQDGLCGYDSLCEITGVPGGLAHMPPEYSHDERVASLVQLHGGARARLRGLICHARSEWDSSNNEERYRKLKEPDGFFGKRQQQDPHGYENFIRFTKCCQFMEHTPFGEGKKFWFFHPLAFIRHFRKCGWIGEQEAGYLIPRHAWISQTGALLTPLSTSLSLEEISGRFSPHISGLNAALRKYLLNSSSERLALFAAQTYIETDRWKTFREYGTGVANPGIPMAQYYGPFYGRGIMQLTWAGAYEKYGEFNSLPKVTGTYDGEQRITQASVHYWEDPTTRDVHNHITGVIGMPKKWAPRFNPDSLATNSFLGCDSEGFFWIWKHHTGTRNISRIADRGFNETTVDKINKLVNGGSFGYFERFAFSFYTRNIFTDWVPPSADLIVNTPRQRRVKVDLARPLERETTR